MEIKMETASLHNGEMEYARFGVGKKFFIIIPGLSIKNILKSAAIVAESYKIFAEEIRYDTSSTCRKSRSVKGNGSNV